MNTETDTQVPDGPGNPDGLGGHIGPPLRGQNKQIINESYNNLEKEAFIWKSNLDNLSLIGIKNDISMIEYAGLGVAMANASEEVRKRANYVAPHCDEDGLVDVIRRFMTD